MQPKKIVVDNNCETFKHENGYTNITICNCRYGHR